MTAGKLPGDPCSRESPTASKVLLCLVRFLSECKPPQQDPKSWVRARARPVHPRLRIPQREPCIPASECVYFVTVAFSKTMCSPSEIWRATSNHLYDQSCVSEIEKKTSRALYSAKRSGSPSNSIFVTLMCCWWFRLSQEMSLLWLKHGT